MSDRKSRLKREYVQGHGGFNPGWDCALRKVNHCWHRYEDGSENDLVCCECFWSNEITVESA